MLFDKHIDEVTKKVIGTLMFLGRVSANLDKSSRIVSGCAGTGPKHNQLLYTNMGHNQPNHHKQGSKATKLCC